MVNISSRLGSISSTNEQFKHLHANGSENLSAKAMNFPRRFPSVFFEPVYSIKEIVAPGAVSQDKSGHILRDKRRILNLEN